MSERLEDIQREISNSCFYRKDIIAKSKWDWKTLRLQREIACIEDLKSWVDCSTACILRNLLSNNSITGSRAKNRVNFSRSIANLPGSGTCWCWICWLQLNFETHRLARTKMQRHFWGRWIKTRKLAAWLTASATTSLSRWNSRLSKYPPLLPQYTIVLGPIVLQTADRYAGDCLET